MTSYEHYEHKINFRLNYYVPTLPLQSYVALCQSAASVSVVSHAVMVHVAEVTAAVHQEIMLIHQPNDCNIFNDTLQLD